MTAAWIYLQTAVNDWLMNMMERVTDKSVDYIWFRGMASRSDTLWDDIVPLAMALGAVFSLIVVGRMAYKAMALEEEIDFMKLWRPLAMCLVISNWFFVTYGIFSLTQPVEDYFREGFRSQNNQIIALQNKRLASVSRLAEMTRDKAAEAEIGDRYEDDALTKTEIMTSGGAVSINDEDINDVLISNYGELYYDMDEAPLDASGEPLPKIDATEEVKSVAVQNFMERVFLWIAEIIWSCAVLVIFLVRAFFLMVLVMFGPVYMAASILPAWEDAWKEWLERYIAVCFLGAAAFLALVFTTYIIIWGLENDTANWEQFVSSEAAWYEWVGHVIWRFICSIGLYLTALFTASGIIGATFELATYFYPSQMVHGAYQMFSGLWGVATGTARDAGDYAYEKGRHHARSAAGRVQAGIIEKNEDKARQSLDMGAAMGPEGEMQDGRRTGEFENRPNTYRDHRDSAAGTSGSATGTAQAAAATATFAAHRWADRLWQQKLAGSKAASRFKSTDRLAAARQDLDEYLKAQQQGRAEAFLKEHSERMRENRILLSIVMTGRVDLHLFGGSAKRRDAFLRKHGLYEAFRRADKLKRKADRMMDDEIRRNIRKKLVHEAREGTAERIFDLIAGKATEILAARGIVTDFSVFDDAELDELRTELGHDGQDSTAADTADTGDGKAADTVAGKRSRRPWERMFDFSGDGNPADWWDDSRDNAGTYRIRETDEGYENVQQQMQHRWFRKLAAGRYNRMLLMRTLQAYEQALAEGRGDRFIRDMQQFGIWQREGIEDDDLAVHPFRDVTMERSEYAGMWEMLRDTERLRRVNEALEAIERANERQEQENNDNTD